MGLHGGAVAPESESMTIGDIEFRRLGNRKLIIKNHGDKRMVLWHHQNRVLVIRPGSDLTLELKKTTQKKGVGSKSGHKKKAAAKKK